MQDKFFVEREKSFAWLKGLQNPDWGQSYTCLLYTSHGLPAKLANHDTQAEKSTMLTQEKALTSESPDCYENQSALDSGAAEC